MQQEGWIKLHRCLLHNPIVMKDAEYLAVWVYLCLKATHVEYPVLFKGKKIMLQPGQLITGRKKIASDLQITESKTRRILSDFENDQQIDRQRSNRNTLISLLNWEKYQANDQQINTQTTNQQPTGDQLATTNKNIKNIKNVKKEREARFIPPTLEEVEAYIKEKHFTINATKFVNHYTANGWIRGKTKMKDWKAAVRYWQTLENEKDEPQKDKFNNFESSQGTDWDAVERNLLQKK